MSDKLTDFNDLYQTEGAAAVKACFDNPLLPEEVIRRYQLNISKEPMPPKADNDLPLPKGFLLTERHLIWRDEDSNESTPLMVSGRIEVVAQTRDGGSSNWGKIVRFKDNDGVEKQKAIPNTMFAGDCRELRELLLKEGLYISTSMKARNKLNDYLNLCNTRKRALCTDKTGWHNGIFILANQVIGDNKETIYFQSETQNNKYIQKGTTEDWKDNIGKYCQGNSRLVFAVSIGFASILLDICKLEGGGFHLIGSSSCGKSTILKTAASVFGGEEYLNTWRATDNGLEGVASAHNDTLLVLDEMGQVEASKAGEIAYMLANGIGKSRANRSGAVKNAYRWRLLFLSSGEIDLSTHMQEGKKSIRAGQEVRLLNIPAIPCENSFGAFECLHGFKSGAEMSAHLSACAKEYYGTPAISFIEAVLKEKDIIYNEFKKDLSAFKKHFLPNEATEQDIRAFERFFLVGWAGEFATRHNITGWKANESINSSKSCFDAWVTNRGGYGNQENKIILEQVKYFFEQNLQSRFADLESGYDKTIISMAGYKKQLEDGEEYLVYPNVFKNDLCKGQNEKLAKDILFAKGWLKSKQASNHWIPKLNSAPRFLIFTSKIWG